MPVLDDDPDPPAPLSWSDLVMPGRPVTFIAAGCQIVVARDAHTFEVALVGTLNRSNRRSVGDVLEAILTAAETTSVSLRRLTELDDAGATMLDDIAILASRSNAPWLVVDGGLMWQTALDRHTSSGAPAPAATSGRPMQSVARRLRRSRRRVLPTT